MKDTTKSVITFLPTDEAKNIHRWVLLDGKKVAIGGDITFPAEPPIPSYVVKEATQEEYRILFESYPNLIKSNAEAVQDNQEKQ